jgi:transposase
MKIYAGTDISSRWFDICVLINDQSIHKQFENSRSGIGSCIKWLESLGIKELDVALEPTGRYGELVAEYFYRRKYRVLQVHPYMFSRYAQSLDMRGKSDFKDTAALAQYCKERGEKLQEWRPKTDVEWELRDMQLLIRGLTKRMVTLQCQLSCLLRSRYVAEELQSDLERCEGQMEKAIARAQDIIKSHPLLARDFELIMSIPGIAEKSAVLLLTLIDFRKFKSSRALSCFLGLTKRRYQSGSTIRGHEGISKRGSKIVRGALFMPARAARLHNEHLRNFSERMLAKGKHDWAIQMAVIRRLVTTAWALVVRQVPFDRSYVNQHAHCPI